MSVLSDVASPTANWIDLRGCRLRYLEAGQGPPLVHIHGAGGLSWDEAKTRLSAQFRVIAPELPGFGESTLGDAVRNIPDMAGLVADFIREVAPEKAHLLGSSFGGRVATWLAVLEPSVVDRLVLEGPANFRSRAQSPANGPTIDPPRQQAVVDRVAPPESFADAAARDQNLRTMALLTGNSPRDDELLGRVADVQVPALVLFGTEDSTVPPEFGHLYKERLRDCFLVFVYGAGHVIRRDRPEAFARVVGDFLERGPAFVVYRGSQAIGA